MKRLTHPQKGRNVTFTLGGASGLLLQITLNNGRSWILRTSIAGKRREIVLGSYPEVGLSDTRNRAREVKKQIQAGIDPLAARKAAQAALVVEQRRGLTFAEAVEQYLEAKLDAFKNAKHRQQWRNTLMQYALPDLGPFLVQDIAVQDVLRVLNQPSGANGETLWQSKTETAPGLCQRIEAVLSWAMASGIELVTIPPDGLATSKSYGQRQPRLQNQRISQPCR